MTDPTTNQPSLTSTVKALFSPATLAALRYTLAALAPLLALFGITGFTPEKISAWVSYAQTFGTAALAIITLAGIAVPLIVAVFGILGSTIKKQIARVKELAANPALANEEAQKALVNATQAIATDPNLKQSVAAVNTLVSATISLPQVQTIVTDAKTAAASTSESVVSADEHDVVKS